MRILNQIIIGFPKELIEEVSPSTAYYLRPVVKMPMLLICYVCGVQTALNFVAFAFMGELLQSGTFLDAPGLITFLVSIAIFSSVFLIVTLNFVMARYDQLDAMPIYQSMNMVMGIICGLVLLGEDERYSRESMIGICIAMLVTIAGIFVLGFKKTLIASEAETQGQDKLQLCLAQQQTSDSPNSLIALD